VIIKDIEIWDNGMKDGLMTYLKLKMQISLSQGNGMSFTEMLLSVEAPSTSQVRSNIHSAAKMLL
jgi:hypothetical protein